MSEATLYYFHDPMCSWCWGFRPAWHELRDALPPQVTVRYVTGGLAADSDVPMPLQQREFLQHTWRRIQREISGTGFNFDFWRLCTPRRSTYPACRALIATRMLAPETEPDMLLAIQRAYYLQARNPSDDEVLIALAVECGLDHDDFSSALNSAECCRLFEEELALCRRYDIISFPSLVLSDGRDAVDIALDYADYHVMLHAISRNLSRFQKVKL